MILKGKKIMMLAAALVVVLSGCRSNVETMETKETTVAEVIMARRSIRYYKDTPVEREVLQKLAEYGVNAPNAMNKQEWEVRIIDSKEYLDGVTELMKEDMPCFVKADDPRFRNGFRNATAVFALACPDSDHDMALLNIGLLGQNICLAAHEMGLGTCIMAGPSVFLTTNPKAKPFLDRLQFSEGYKLRYVIGVGYPDEAPDAKPRDLGKIKFVE